MQNGDTRPGECMQDEYKYETGVREYKVFSLTENELDALLWSSWLGRRRIINRVKEETVFPFRPTDEG